VRHPGGVGPTRLTPPPDRYVHETIRVVDTKPPTVVAPADFGRMRRGYFGGSARAEPPHADRIGHHPSDIRGRQAACDSGGGLRYVRHV
jgi:hypothetical protein